MWLEADCNLTGGESLVRQIIKGERFFRKNLEFQQILMASGCIWIFGSIAADLEAFRGSVFYDNKNCMESVQSTSE
mgnify:CR=1 FL=1